jgi:hypothetical protein
MNNPWVNFSGRSYKTIKTALLGSLRSKVPELQDRSPSNIMMIILDIFAGLSEVMHYYIDAVGRELYSPSAKRLSSLLKIAENLNYSGKARIPASVDVLVTLLSPEGEPIEAPQDINIPAFSIFNDEDGLPWANPREWVLKEGLVNTRVSLKQFGALIDLELGVSTGLDNQSFELPGTYAEGSLVVMLKHPSSFETVLWTKTDSFQTSLSDDTHYRVYLNASKRMVLAFGDGVNGAIPEVNFIILISYRITTGRAGNIDAGQEFSTPSAITLPTDHTLEIKNPSKAYGGYQVEDFVKLQKSIPQSIYTGNRIVTRKDFERAAETAPGIRAAKLDHVSPIYPIKLYVVPNLGGEPSLELLEDTRLFLKRRSLIGPDIRVLPSGESLVRAKLTVYGNYGVSKEKLLSDARVQLNSTYAPQLTGINQPVLYSEIVAGLHGLASIKHVILSGLYVRPYFRALLNPGDYIEYDVRVHNWAVRGDWTVYYREGDTNYVQVYLNGVIVTEILEGNFGAWFEDIGGFGIDIKIDLVIASSDNPYWDFRVYPTNRDIFLDDFSIPVSDLENSEIDIVEDHGG